MKWKAQPDGNLRAALLRDWLIAQHEGILVMQLRIQSDDGSGSPQIEDVPIGLPLELAKQFSAQLRECLRSGSPQQGDAATEQ